MAKQPDYGAIQSTWIRAYQARGDFATVREQLLAAERNAAEARKVWEAQRPTFRMVNQAALLDLERLEARLSYYRETLDGDPSGYPWVFAALTYGADVASDYADKAPEGATATVRKLGLAPMRGDLSRSVGVLWVMTEGAAGWEQSVWDSWLLAITAGPVAEILADAGVDADAQVILKDLTGRTRDERRAGIIETAGAVLGLAGAAFGLYAAWRWRK